MVVGDRLSSTYFEENKRPFHNFGNTLVRNMINFLFRTEIKDILTGYRAFSYRFVKTFPVLSEGFEIETEMSIHAADKHLAIENVIIDYRDRPEGSESKLNTYSDGVKVIFKIVGMLRTYRPIVFFGVIALILAALGIGFAIPVFVEYVQTGLVRRFPTLFVCGFVLLSGIIAFFSGAVLQTLYQKSRQDFELALYQAMGDERRLSEEE